VARDYAALLSGGLRYSLEERMNRRVSGHRSRRGRWVRFALLVSFALLVWGALVVAPTVPVAGAAAVNPPINTNLPTIIGDVRVGTTLTADPGTWTNQTGAFTYEWDRCITAASCVPIPGATEQSYTPVSADAGAQLRVRVTATSPTSDTATAEAITPGGVQLAIKPVPGNVALPTIVGEARAHETVTGTVGLWADSPTSFALQWLRCATAAGTACAAIPGQTTASYDVTGADVGSTLRLQVIATNANGSSAPVLSAPTGLVQPEVVRARFNVVPQSACTGVPVRLDASSSRGTNAPITYHFTYRNVPEQALLAVALGLALSGSDELLEDALDAAINQYPWNQSPYDTRRQDLVDGAQSAPVVTFNWDRQLERDELTGKAGDWARDPILLSLTVTDGTGSSDSITQVYGFKQVYSSVGRASCPPPLPVTRLYSFGSSFRVSISSSAVVLSIPCRTVMTCAGRVQISTVARRATVNRARIAPIVIADSSVFDIAGHQRGTVEAQLTPDGLQLLRPHRRVRVRVVVTSVNALGSSVQRSFTKTLLRRH
jgi:hypothetical protein